MSVTTANRIREWCPTCVDFHTHFLQAEVFTTAHQHTVCSCLGRNLISPELPMMKTMFEPELQIEGMNKHGIDINLLSSADVIQNRSWATPEEDRRMSAIVNDECASWVARFPDRFIGSAVLPLGNMSFALEELERACALGLRVLNLSSNYRGAYLGEPKYEDLWSAVVERDLIVFIHPDGVQDTWFQSYALWNSIGQSIEEVKVMSSLIYEGVLDRHPGVKIVMAHGGGYMPHYMGRIDRNVTYRPDTAKNLSKLPSEYLKDFYYDSCVYDPRTLELLIERVGVDHVVLGGDYPVGLFDPVDFLDRANLTDSERGAIAGTNAAKLLSIAGVPLPKATNKQ